MAEFCAMRYPPPSPPQRAHPPMSQRRVSRNLRACPTKRMYYGGGPDLLNTTLPGRPGQRPHFRAHF